MNTGERKPSRTRMKKAYQEEETSKRVRSYNLSDVQNVIHGDSGIVLEFYQGWYFNCISLTGDHAGGDPSTSDHPNIFT